MSTKRKILIIALPVLVVIGLLIVFLSQHNVPVLTPAGTIAAQERNLFVFALILAAFVVIPVYSLTILIALKYRESNKKARYEPNWDHSRVLETIWWGIPMAIIAVLSVVTWTSSHALDPYKPIASVHSTINVEVVSLDWKWLFIYPNQSVASVNQLAIPVNHPVHFYITSDTVMNSFWIPSLGGQIYAMPGMMTQLNLEASKLGSYYGSSANISGKGFAGMHFEALSLNYQAFSSWLHKLSQSRLNLNIANYKKLARPSEYNPVAYYKDPANNLFSDIINQYMTGAKL